MQQNNSIKNCENNKVLTCDDMTNYFSNIAYDLLNNLNEKSS